MFDLNSSAIVRTNKMSPIIETLTESFNLGEGPHWDAKTKNLYFVDFVAKTIQKYNPQTKKLTKASIADAVQTLSLIIPVEGTHDKFLVAYDSELAIITWDGHSEKPTKIEKVANLDVPNFIFNDGKADSTGRLWIGGHVLPNKTMDKITTLDEMEPKGFLLSLNSSTKQLQRHVDGVRISNGIAWSPNYDKLYYIDSVKKTIDQFEYDIKNGMIRDRKSIFSLEKHNIPGIPDGQTIDTDGNLWVAIFGGGCVIKIDPRRPEVLLQTVALPTQEVTSLAFGGENLDELYVTTANRNFKGEVLKEPIHGPVYKITGTGSKGFAGFNVKI